MNTDHSALQNQALITVTIFPDRFAKAKETLRLTLDELAERINGTTARSKERLPLLKLAEFGDQATPKGCLRSNANMSRIWGVEADYDAGEIPFEAACDTLEKAGLRAIAYTTPSHKQPGKGERWRLLLPLSKPLPKDRRTALVARLNGVFKGRLAGESFSLSQSMYFGAIASRKSDYGVFIFDGDFLDARDDLDAGAIGPAVTFPGRVNGHAGQSWTLEDLDHQIAEYKRTGDYWHNTIVTVSASLVARGWDRSRIAEKCGPICWGGEDDPEMLSIVDSAIAKFGRVAPNPDLIQQLRDVLEQPEQTKSDAKPDVITATPYVWVDPATIPPRQFLYGRRLVRQYASATVAPGGVGKTALEVTEALAMATGKPLLGVNCDPCRVWLWSLEDPREEMVRRVQAAAKHYRLTAEDLGDRLLVDTAREQRLVVARKTRESTEIAEPVVAAIVRQIKHHRIDVLIIDPFISCHDVPENDNSAIDAVTKLWAEVANHGNCAVELVHHVRKGEKEITTESARGGAAFSDACRMVRVVNRMDAEEGAKHGLQNHRLYFRTYIDKNNLAPPADKSDWFTLVSTDLGNGDRIGVAASWEYPSPDKTYSADDFRKASQAIEGGSWRADRRALRWVGIPIAQALGLDLDEPANRIRVMELVKNWTKQKLLVEVERKDDTRMNRTFVEVSEVARIRTSEG